MIENNPNEIIKLKKRVKLYLYLSYLALVLGVFTLGINLYRLYENIASARGVEIILERVGKLVLFAMYIAVSIIWIRIFRLMENFHDDQKGIKIGEEIGHE